jgi:hypothetical protein
VLVIRGELSSCRPVCEPHIRRDDDPTTVPHTRRESSKGTAPLCEDDAEAPRRTTATFPRSPGRSAVAVLPDLI